MAELLFWPALLAYGEAAVAYLGEARRPGLPGRLATWGVRIGWLVQTALLGFQAARASGFPWSTWAGSQFATFCVCLAGMLALAATLYHVELAGKRLDVRLRELRELLA